MDDARAAIDRLLPGDLLPAEQRQLAQAALDDPDLFERLIAAAAAQSVLRSPGQVDAPQDSRPMPRDRRHWNRFAAGAVGVVAAAALVLAVYPRSTSRLASSSPSREVTQPPLPIPMPILLMARPGAVSTETFRADEAASRLPKPSGTVVAVHGASVDLDLGSLDGLTNGLQLHVGHGPRGSFGARIRITAVFRERSRAQRISGELRAGDRVMPSAPVYVKALLAAADARLAGQDLSGAKRLLESAVGHAQSPVSGDLRRRAFEQLGSIHHREHDLDAAARALESAAADFDTAPAARKAERADLLAELGVVRIEQGRYADAGQTLEAAREYATGATAMRVVNNLGALAALRGDRASAEPLYRLARSLAGTSPELAEDRAGIEKNLSAISRIH
jgi:hypothetical protein